MVEQNLWSWFLDMSLPSPQVVGLLNKESSPFLSVLVFRVLAFEWWAAESEFCNNQALVKVFSTKKLYSDFIQYETEQDPVGLLGTETFLCPPFLIGSRLQPSWSSLSYKRQIRTVSNLGRERMQRQREEQSRNNSAALGQGPGSASMDTHNIFKLFTRLKPPTNGRC